MDFLITLTLAGLAGWLASLLYNNLDLSPVVYFLVGIFGGMAINLIFTLLNLPFLSGYLGNFCFALIGSLFFYGVISILSRLRNA